MPSGSESSLTAGTHPPGTWERYQRIDGVPLTSRNARATTRRGWPRHSEMRESQLCVMRFCFGGLISKNEGVASQRAVILCAS